MIFVRMREDHPFEPGEVDLKLCDLPEGVRTEIDHGVGVDKVTAPAAELFAAQLFRPGAERALTPESRNAFRRRRAEKCHFHRKRIFLF